MNRIALGAALVILAVGTGPAAADTIARGAVLKLEARELYLNLGKVHGLVTGAALRLKRPIKLKHPVTGAWLIDWVPLGSARVTAVRDRLSMVLVDAELAGQVRVGDLAEVYVERDEVLEPTPAPTGGEPLAAVDPATARVLDLWQASTRLTLDQRISAWERFVAADPDGPHAAALRQDIAILREQREAQRLPEETAEAPAVGGVQHAGPSRARAGAPVGLSFLVAEPARLSSAWLHYRRVGEATYRRALLGRDHDLYLRGEIPADAVSAPGLEYFVEVATTQGDVGTAVGSPEAPLAVAVAGPPLASQFGNERHRSQVALRTTNHDLANRDDRPGDRTDVFYLFETDITYRVGATLRGIRVGFGSVQGEGGFKDRTYTASAPAPEVGFTYGYAEAELGLAPRVGAALRLITGVGQTGLGAGVEGRLRLGAIEDTNLSLILANVAELGALSELRLEVQALDRLPLGLAAAVTDQASRGDLGVRLSLDLGWRAIDWITPTVRVSYQARSIDHAGLGAGLALVMGW